MKFHRVTFRQKVFRLNEIAIPPTQSRKRTRKDQIRSLEQDILMIVSHELFPTAGLLPPFN